MFILTTGYLLFEAESIIEMSQSLYVALTELAGFIHLAITLWKMPKMAELIDTIDKFIEKSLLKFNIKKIIDEKK